MIQQNNREYITYNLFPLSFALWEVTDASEVIHTNTLWHDEIEIKYILEGQAEIICGERIYVAHEGDLVFINPCELHTTRLVNHQPCTYYLLMLTPDHFLPFDNDQLMENVCSGRRHIRNVISGDEYVQQVFQGIADAIQQKKTAFKLNAFGRITQLMSHLLEQHLVQHDSPQVDMLQRQAQRLQPAMQQITMHYDLYLPLEQLAECCGLSVSYFCHLFKEVTGKSPIAYLTQLRINKAELLLNTTEMSVAEVAAAVGYADSSNFARVFKKATGHAPSACHRAGKDR